MFERRNKANRCLTEERITVIKKGEIHSLQLDLAYEIDEKWTIVDFKTGSADEGQLQQYKEHLALWLGIKESQIEAQFYYVSQ